MKEFPIFWKGYLAWIATWGFENNLQGVSEQVEEYSGRIEDNAYFKGGRL